MISRSDRSQCVLAGFTGSDADDLLQCGPKDLAVADLAGACGGFDGFDDEVEGEAVAPASDLDLGQEIDHIFRAAVQLGMAFLASKPLTSVTVIPCTPMADKASRTSSSLKGLTMAVTIFMVGSPMRLVGKMGYGGYVCMICANAPKQGTHDRTVGRCTSMDCFGADGTLQALDRTLIGYRPLKRTSFVRQRGALCTGPL